LAEHQIALRASEVHAPEVDVTTDGLATTIMGLTITNSSDSAVTGSLSTQEVANAAQSLLLEATASLFRDRSHDFVTETPPSSPHSISTFDDYPPLSASPPSLSPSADAMPPSSDEDTSRPLNQFGKNGHGQRRRKPPPALTKPLISGRNARDLTILNSLEAEYRVRDSLSLTITRPPILPWSRVYARRV